MKKLFMIVCLAWFWWLISLAPALAFEENVSYKIFRLGTNRIGELKLLNPYWNEDLGRLTENAQRKLVIKRRRGLFEFLSGLENEVKPDEMLKVDKEDYRLVYRQIRDRIGDKWEIQAEDGRHFRGRISGFILYRAKIARGIFRGLKLFSVITPDKEFSPGKSSVRRQSFYNLIGLHHRYPKPKIRDFVLIGKKEKPDYVDSFWAKEEIYVKLGIRDRHTSLKYLFWHDLRQSDKNLYMTFTIREFGDPESHRGLYKLSAHKTTQKLILGRPIVPSGHSDRDGCLDLHPESRFKLKIRKGMKQFYVLSCNCFIGEYSVIMEQTAKGSRAVCYSESIDAWKRNW